MLCRTGQSLLCKICRWPKWESALNTFLGGNSLQKWITFWLAMLYVEATRQPVPRNFVHGVFQRLTVLYHRFPVWYFWVDSCSVILSKLQPYPEEGVHCLLDSYLLGRERSTNGLTTSIFRSGCFSCFMDCGIWWHFEIGWCRYPRKFPAISSRPQVMLAYLPQLVIESVLVVPESCVGI